MAKRKEKTEKAILDLRLQEILPLLNMREIAKVTGFNDASVRSVMSMLRRGELEKSPLMDKLTVKLSPTLCSYIAGDKWDIIVTMAMSKVRFREDEYLEYDSETKTVHRVHGMEKAKVERDSPQFAILCYDLFGA
jgi:hypothetical protein